jgi:hypothetical protein
MDIRHHHVARSDGSHGNPSAAELQRRLQETSQSITQTVGEMKTTMNTQYQHAKDRAMDSIDWRVQMRRYPIAAAVGALGIGFLVGRSLGHYSEEEEYIGSSHGREPDFTTLHGSSLAPSSSSGSRSIVSPQVRSRLSSRVEGVLSDLAENFLNELTRVGRDVVVPSVIGAITNKLHDSGVTRTSHVETTQHNVGGTGSFGSQQSTQTTHGGGTYQGRAL